MLTWTLWGMFLCTAHSSLEIAVRRGEPVWRRILHVGCIPGFLVAALEIHARLGGL